MEGLVFVAVAAVVGTKLINKAYNDFFDLDKKGYDAVSRRALLAMLVHCTYYRDLNLLAKGVAWSFDYNNTRAEEYGKLHWKTYQCGKSLSDLRKLGLAFLTPKYRHHNRSAPGLAIVLRGTIVNIWEDIEADLRISVERLNRSKRVIRTVSLIVSVVRGFLKDNPNTEICIAGHSLGAAIALIIGGVLVETYGIYIDTHLFNPPLLTIENIFTRIALPSPDPNTPKLCLDCNELKHKIFRIFASATALENEMEQFKSLQHWVPKFYLNPGDSICKRYIEFYEEACGSCADVMSWQGLLSSLFRPGQKFLKNVAPSAIVYKSTWSVGSHRLAHSLMQWHKYKDSAIFEPGSVKSYCIECDADTHPYDNPERRYTF